MTTMSTCYGVYVWMCVCRFVPSFLSVWQQHVSTLLLNWRRRLMWVCLCNVRVSECIRCWEMPCTVYSYLTPAQQRIWYIFLKFLCWNGCPPHQLWCLQLKWSRCMNRLLLMLCIGNHMLWHCWQFIQSVSSFTYFRSFDMNKLFFVGQ